MIRIHQFLFFEDGVVDLEHVRHAHIMFPNQVGLLVNVDVTQKMKQDFEKFRRVRSFLKVNNNIELNGHIVWDPKLTVEC